MGFGSISSFRIYSATLLSFLNISELQARRMGFVDWQIILLSILGPSSLREIQGKILSHKSRKFIFLFDLVAILAGLLARYVIEYGEVSKSHFTGANILLHTPAYLAMTGGIWPRPSKTNKNQ